MTPPAIAAARTDCPTALVASPNPYFRKRILETLAARSWLGEEAQGGAEALAKVEEGGWQALVVDRWLPDLDVQELVGIVRDRHPRVEVFVLDPPPGMTASGDTSGSDPALEALLHGLSGSVPLRPSPAAPPGLWRRNPYRE